MEVRIDKWLWAVRLYKTRQPWPTGGLCKKGKVLIQNVAVKPSRTVKVGEIVQVRQNPVVYSFKVIALAQNRMNAKLVPGFMENVTTPDQLELIELYKIAAQSGSGTRNRTPHQKRKKRTG